MLTVGDSGGAYNSSAEEVRAAALEGYWAGRAASALTVPDSLSAPCSSLFVSVTASEFRIGQRGRTVKVASDYPKTHVRQYGLGIRRFPNRGQTGGSAAGALYVLSACRVVLVSGRVFS